MEDGTHFGVDLGGTTIKVGAVRNGELVSSLQRPTPHHFEDCVGAIAELVAETSNGSAPAIVGVGVPGVVDFRSGEVLDAPNLEFLERRPLGRSLAERIGSPVVLENDATAAALGEARFGAGRTHRSFLFATIGTGIGGGLFLDGRIYRGPGGMAGEFGHLSVGHDRLCGCGARGCLEAVLSAPSLLAWAEEQGVSAQSLPDLADKARTTSAPAKALFRQAGAYLGEALAQVALLLDVRVFLIGGGGAPVLDLLKDSALQILAMRAFGRNLDDFLLAASELGNQAGILGASVLEPGTR